MKKQLGPRLYSRDYLTLYFPLTDVAGETNDKGEYVFNKSYAFSPYMETPRYGRLFVSINPALNEFFKEISFPNIVEPGEAILIQGKAKRNFPEEELRENVTWLYRISAIGRPS